MLYVWSGAGAALVMETVGLHIRAAGVQYQLVHANDVPHNLQPEDVVLCMGKKVITQLAMRGMIPGSAGPGSLRGKRITGEGTGADFLVSFDPRVTYEEARHFAEFEWDAKLAVRLHETGTIRPEVGDNYQWADDLGELVLHVQTKFEETGHTVRVGFDLETQGLFPYYEGKNIITSQWCAQAGRSYVVDHRPHWDSAAPGLNKVLAEQIGWLLNTPEVRIWGANLKFDLEWIAIKWADWKMLL